jgi:hypothetical protein
MRLPWQSCRYVGNPWQSCRVYPGNPVRYLGNPVAGLELTRSRAMALIFMCESSPYLFEFCIFIYVFLSMFDSTVQSLLFSSNLHFDRFLYLTG